MSGKTHMMTGIAAALLIHPPKNLGEMLVGTGVAAVGAVISDIDVGTSKSHKKADQVMAVCLCILGLAVAAEGIWHIGIYQKVRQDQNLTRMLIFAGIFLGLCVFGKEQPHRSFMHSVLAGILLTVCVQNTIPLAEQYFATAFASHLILDFFNRKGERLFWPLKKGFCLGLCQADGIVDKVLFRTGAVATAGALFYAIVTIF